MSYHISLHFKKVNTELEALTLIQTIQKEELQDSNIKELVDENYYWLSFKYKKYFKTKDYQLKQIVLKELLSELFGRLYYYWPEYKLIGMVYANEKLPDTFKSFFDGHIDFQNLCDQDYSYDTWKVLGEWTSTIIEQTEKLTAEEVWKQLYAGSEVYINDLESVIKNEDYYKRSLVYQQIEDRLDIDKAVWIEPSDKFIFIRPLPQVVSADQSIAYSKVEAALDQKFKKNKD